LVNRGIFDRRRGTPATAASEALTHDSFEMYRGNRQSDTEQAYADKWTNLADRLFNLDNAKQAHVVQFYTDDIFLRECICEFVRSALADNESAIVVASKKHRHGLTERLQLRGVDVRGAIKQGRYIVLDALMMLEKFISGGLPDKRKFETIFAPAIESAQTASGTGQGRVAVFGEMVALLWAEGNFEAALQLENLWNELAKTRPFYLRCAYPATGFQGEHMSEPYSAVCSHHSAIISAESYT
jgi:hypothetical protein